MRIGIFGGTFNPVHQGHLIAAEEIRERFQLQRIAFVPSARPPHKPAPQIINAKHRLEMTRLAITKNPHFDISSIELDRSGPSYSVETVEAYRKQVGEKTALFFIMGIDSFADMNSWHEPERLIGLCHFIIISRPDFNFNTVRHLLLNSFGIQAQRNDLKIPLPNGHFLYLTQVTTVGISSTQIRERLRQGRSVKYLLPESVESYILSNDLYIDM